MAVLALDALKILNLLFQASVLIFLLKQPYQV